MFTTCRPNFLCEGYPPLNNLTSRSIEVTLRRCQEIEAVGTCAWDGSLCEEAGLFLDATRERCSHAAPRGSISANRFEDVTR